ncbi:hypothetical protein EDB81DRAFT_903170 [Dactylonectria macrodidyma]|uniref:Uncharacterized protein n=1 Tax=Dactylonectria macrodidyma TaxID=307937 RepID=A0A9P9EBZ1_9HYPO|nr:hypothetical protein EDB81DRAFT_903170 [Dactylonectria macrodidyma]
MGLKNLIISLLALQAGPGLGHPYHHGRHHRSLHESHAHLEVRDTGEELVCPPIPDKLIRGADLIAKIRFNDRDTCDAKLVTRAVSAMAVDPDDPYSCSENEKDAVKYITWAKDHNWRGNGVLYNSQCHESEVALAFSTQAGGGYVCTDGRKFLYCEAEAKQPDCRWTDCKEECDSDSENELT